MKRSMRPQKCSKRLLEEGETGKIVRLATSCLKEPNCPAARNAPAGPGRVAGMVSGRTSEAGPWNDLK